MNMNDKLTKELDKYVGRDNSKDGELFWNSRERSERFNGVEINTPTG